MTLLAVENLRTEFRQSGAWQPAVAGISFTLQKGEILGLVGESGCGKSTVAYSLMRLLPGNARIAGGAIRFAGQDLATLPEPAMRRLRGRSLGMIFQDPMTALDPAFRIGSQIEETLVAHLPLARTEARARAIALLQAVGMPAPEERLRAFPHELSGGMRQRVALAIAISCNPDLLIADEPTTALDVTIQAQILHLIRSLLVSERGAGVLLITHDLGVVAQVCDRVAVMYAGDIVETGPVAQVLGSPLHPYTQALLRAAPSERAPRGQLPTIPGTVPPPSARPTGCAFRPRCDCALPACADPAAPPRHTPQPDREVACVHAAA
jgi:oligopeptide/dipeptide ABC transporter ATP-binding protein